ncbi:hypothetical protein KFZ70_12090 [Tamlana fucoidanivorans]|uniref:Uncharacterized protein n=1 Tax=Allotamlana fucoidanivorans TaxID=2583814 RepID=A0A5C4SN30_9FLAO|nr:hypothetical protein [Tamlana fucoidanivorans]TNJ44980.1 hypothetical protein FGF67_07430 [Tamlana fucoidanivorans]
MIILINLYKEVDASGIIITDFSGLVTSIRNFMSTGFKLRIVLSKVPWKMVENKVVSTYRNTSPLMITTTIRLVIAHLKELYIRK